jgi:outer membrane protein assembly factor BamD (BamD/ComL family)
VKTRIRPVPIARLRLIVVLASVAASLFLGCAGRTTEKSGPDRYSRSTSVSTDRNQALLEQGRQARADGRWGEALDHFREVSENDGAKAEQRQQAFYELGLAYSDLLNPSKDFDQAIGSLTRLVSEYPDSPLRRKAEDQIARIRKLQNKTGK